MPKIDVRDTTLHYEMAGEGDVALLFIHGMCGGSWSWEDQMNRLSPEFTCIAYDRRGHSRSGSGVEDQSNSTHADDTAALVRALGLDRPILVGSSSGGNVAIEVLDRYPELVQGTVLMEPPLFSLDTESEQRLVKEIGPSIQHALENSGPRAAVDAFFKIIAPQYWSGMNEGKRDRMRDNAALLFASLEATGATISVDDLASINLPVLVVAGADSHPVLRSLSRALTEGLPNSRFVEFEDCGHVVYAEKPAEFAQAISAFAHEITGSGTTSGRRVDTGAPLR